MVRPHLEYDIQTIFKTTKKNWAVLDGIQFQALRVALGLMKSTPTNVILSEAGELPLELRRFLISIKHLSRNNSKVQQILMDFYLLYNENPKYWRNCKASGIMEGFDMALQYTDNLEKLNNHACYEAEYKCQFVDLRFIDSSIKKYSLLAQAEYNEIIQDKFKDFDQIFTDASVDPETGKAGIGIYAPTWELEVSNKLIDKTNISTAESIAIKTAINICKDLSNNILLVSVVELNILPPLSGKTGLK